MIESRMAGDNGHGEKAHGLSIISSCIEYSTSNSLTLWAIIKSTTREKYKRLCTIENVVCQTNVLIHNVTLTVLSYIKRLIFVKEKRCYWNKKKQSERYKS